MEPPKKEEKFNNAVIRVRESYARIKAKRDHLTTKKI
jgi:hypothetical protein